MNYFLISIHHQPRVRVCVPVPFYHCFGSVLGGMSMAVHGITLVFPSAAYNSCANLEAIQSEKYSTTHLHYHKYPAVQE